MQQEEGDLLLQPAVAAVTASGVPFTAEILEGDIPHQIVKRATELGCAGIIMGTRGTGAIANLVIGSVATNVVHLTKLPVTLVH